MLVTVLVTSYFFKDVKMKGEIYKIGDEVVHDVFGDGVIVDKIYNRYTKKPIIVVKFNSLNTNRNIVASFYGIRKKKNNVAIINFNITCFINLFL